MTKKMIEKFDKYWHVIHYVMGAANILDPRFKIKYREFFYPQIYGNDYYQEEIDRIKNICYDFVFEYQSKQAKASSNSFTKEVVPQYLNAFEVLCKSKTKKILVWEN
ncbi:DUF4413 domain-containing protein [Cephalotus follicularis]|uniref:DUF4413 domain-containing protein n=1 Tax=Cephalotus follicularis TaxID=3775 RepID=A0A1Q3CSC9_CEPFO|nr:DUF4413 domain-containing protein [Cephalotus follicularis]